MQTICFGEGQVAEPKPKKPESRSLTALCIPVGAWGGITFGLLKVIWVLAWHPAVSPLSPGLRAGIQGCSQAFGAPRNKWQGSQHRRIGMLGRSFSGLP